MLNADFHGTLLDGSVFWSSIENGEPLVIPLSQLIPGCQKAIALMQVGDKWRVFIHPALAYGEQGRPGIPLTHFDFRYISPFYRNIIFG